MVKDDLYVTIPSFFRCPISLDVMKSPVSLCTGVTYDRSSIQRWLDDGNNTCPATMQVLHTKEFVPNRTLQRLIQIWSDSRHRRVDSVDSSPKPLLSQDQVLDLIRRLDIKSECSFDSLSKIVCFARESDENRKFLAEADGFVSMLVEFLANAGDGASRSLDLAEVAVRVLDMIRNEIADVEKVASSMLRQQSSCLEALVLVLQKGSVESRIRLARVLEAITVKAEAKLMIKIGEKEEVLKELLKLISPEKDGRVMEAGLSCLIAISMARRVKVKLVNLGVVKSLGKCLGEQNLTVSTAEKVLKMLERVSSVKEGWSEISECECECECVVERIVQRLMKVSNVATEHAVTVLWSICYVHRNRAAQEAVEKANGVTKILLIMQTNCSPAVRQMSADLLKIFRLSSSKSSSFLSSYDTNTTHITPF